MFIMYRHDLIISNFRRRREHLNGGCITYLYPRQSKIHLTTRFMIIFLKLIKICS